VSQQLKVNELKKWLINKKIVFYASNTRVQKNAITRTYGDLKQTYFEKR